jgi:tRNA(Ile)-lysidine synthetase-like protein
MQSDIYQEVISFFKTYFPHSSPRVCVAVSGGGDSVALFHILKECASQIPLQKLGIIHANHHLRGKESDGDAALVKKLAEHAGVDFYCKDLRPPSVSSGLEEWGRLERYAFFSQIQEKNGFDYIATGHTADDQAETVLLRLMRGCGLKGLCAISPIRNDGIIRPLLTISRSQLRDFLVQGKIDFREDSSNKDLRFNRNWVRHELLARMVEQSPKTVLNLTSIADHARRSFAIIGPIINTWKAHNVAYEHDGGFLILKTGLHDTPIAAEALAEIFREKKISFDCRHINEVFENSSKNSRIFLLRGGWCYYSLKESLEFSPSISVLKARLKDFL